MVELLKAGDKYRNQEWRGGDAIERKYMWKKQVCTCVQHGVRTCVQEIICTTWDVYINVF